MAAYVTRFYLSRTGAHPAALLGPGDVGGLEMPLRKQEEKGWIGVDLDGTLAQYDCWRGEEHIGDPIPDMVARVRYWIDSGQEVRIFSARADTPKGVGCVYWWCAKHLGVVLPVTNVKDSHMIELWDDRVVQVERNTGRVLLPHPSDPLPTIWFAQRRECV